MSIEFPAYVAKVMARLHEIGYVDYVIGYNPIDVAQSLFGAMLVMWKSGASHLFCANMIFGHTWEKLKYGINVESTPPN